MSRISRLDRSEVTADLAALFDKVFAQRGNVPNMFRVMAHRARNLRHHAGILRRRPEHRHRLNQAQSVQLSLSARGNQRHIKG